MSEILSISIPFIILAILSIIYISYLEFKIEKEKEKVKK